jgi:dienelactone hydrolase
MKYRSLVMGLFRRFSSKGEAGGSVIRPASTTGGFTPTRRGLTTPFPYVEELTYQDVTPVEEGKVDIYHRGEALSKARPLLVYVHGGGWRQGDKKDEAEKSELAFANGFNFASVNYRLSPYEGSSRPKDTWSAKRFKKDHVHDVAKAVAFIQTNCYKYNCDPSKIILIGHSSGAHLVALLCARPTLLAKEGVNLVGIKGGVVVDTNFMVLKDRYQVTDPLVPNAFGISPDNHVGQSWRYLDYATQKEADAVYTEYSPSTHVSSTSLPVMIATRGPAGAVRICENYFTKHKALGVPNCFLHKYPGDIYDHNQINQCIGKPASLDPPAGKALPRGEVRITDAIQDAFKAWLAL